MSWEYREKQYFDPVLKKYVNTTERVWIEDKPQQPVTQSSPSPSPSPSGGGSSSQGNILSEWGERFNSQADYQKAVKARQEAFNALSRQDQVLIGQSTAGETNYESVLDEASKIIRRTENQATQEVSAPVTSSLTASNNERSLFGAEPTSFTNAKEQMRQARTISSPTESQASNAQRLNQFLSVNKIIKKKTPTGFTSTYDPNALVVPQKDVLETEESYERRLEAGSTVREINEAERQARDLMRSIDSGSLFVTSPNSFKKEDKPEVLSGAEYKKEIAKSLSESAKAKQSFILESQRKEKSLFGTAGDLFRTPGYERNPLLAGAANAMKGMESIERGAKGVSEFVIQGLEDPFATAINMGRSLLFVPAVLDIVNSGSHAFGGGDVLPNLPYSPQMVSTGFANIPGVKQFREEWQPSSGFDVTKTYSPEERVLAMAGEVGTGLAANFLLFKGMGKVAGKVGGRIKNAVAFRGKKYVEPSEVFTRETLATGKLPTTKGVKESLKRFGKSDDVVHASMKSLAKEDIAGLSKSYPYEDPGIFTTPAGEATPLRFQFSKDVGYSLNPKAWLASLKESLTGKPTLTYFKTKGVKTLPKSVIKAKGFEPVKEYFESLAREGKQGKAYITKRSTLGNTKEIEAVIPYKQAFRETAYDKYTSYGGKNIAIREAELINELSGKSAASKAAGGKTFSASDVVKSSRYSSKNVLPAQLLFAKASTYGGYAKPLSKPYGSVPSYPAKVYSPSNVAVSSSPSILSQPSKSIISRISKPSGASRVSSPSAPSQVSPSIIVSPVSPSPSYPKKPTPSRPSVSKYKTPSYFSVTTSPRVSQPLRQSKLLIPKAKTNVQAKKRRVKENYFYVPSFTSVVFGRKGKKPKQKEFTGILESRPIITR